MTPRDLGLTKPQHRLLERAWEAEIDGAMSKNGLCLVQLRPSKALTALLEAKMLAPAEVTLKGWPPIVIRGYELTHAGRMAYCLTCEEIENE